MYNFCTYFDHNYLSMGLTLYESLLQHCSDFRLFILCLSKECYEILSKLDLKNIKLIKLEELEASDKDILGVKQNRTLIEYYFTITPLLPLYILNNYPETELITYLDSDLYFFDDPAPIFEEITGKSTAIIGHRFSPKIKGKENPGKFNVGWITFRRDENGLNCLRWYRQKCIEWCYDRVEENKYADQKYLDYFQDKFQGVMEIQHKGANIAPWNIDNYNVQIKHNKIYIDDVKLIFFHFNGLKRVFGPLYDSGFSVYNASLTRVIRKYIYVSYLDALVDVSKKTKCQMNIGRINGIRDKTKSRIKELEKLSPALFKIIIKGKRIMKVLMTKTHILHFSLYNTPKNWTHN